MIDYEDVGKRVRENLLIIFAFGLMCLWLAVAITAPMAILKFCYLYLHG
jgi:hypothetical protein